MTGEDRESPNVTDENVITWTYRMPILNNRFIMWDMVRVVLLSAVLSYAVLIIMGLLFEGELVLMPLAFMALITGIVFVAFLIAGVLLGNHLNLWFGVGPAGIAWASGKREKTVNRIATVAGILGGSASTTGAGLLATANESGTLPWSDVYRAIEYSDRRVITIRNSWRSVVRLYCTPENWDGVRAVVEEGAARGAAERALLPPKTKRRWWVYAAWVLGSALGAVLVTAWPALAYEDGVRSIAVSAALLAVAGLTQGLLRRAAALLSLLPVCYVSTLVMNQAFTIYDTFGEGGAFSGWQYATELLAVTVVGLAVMFALGLWRLLGKAPAVAEA
jgi:hypothetical protein